MLRVFLAAPDHLDRLAWHLLGNHHCLAGEVLRALAAQAAAELHRVHQYLGLVDASRARCRGQRALGVLGRSPDLELIGLQPGRADHGLHGRVRQIGGEIFGLNDLASFAQSVFGVAVVAGHRQLGLVEAALEVLHDGGAAQLTMSTHIPINGHLAQRFLGAPVIVGHHRYELTQVEHLDNAAAILHLGRIHGAHLAIEDRAGRHSGVQHAGHLRIDAIADAAGDDVGNVDPCNRLADDGPVLGVLELNFLGRLHLGSGQGQLAVGDGALAGSVGHPALGRGALAGRHAPLLGRRCHEHVPGSGTGLAQVFLRLADGAAAHGGHVAIGALGGQVLMGRNIFNTHPTPIGIELLGHQHRCRSPAALAHFGAGVTNHHRLVGPHLNPSVELGRAGRVAATGQIKTQAQASGCGGRRLEEKAPIRALNVLLVGVHARTPFAETA